MWELSAKGGEFGEGICSKISEGFGKVVRRSSVLAVLSGFGGAEWRRCRCRTMVGRAGACEAEDHSRGGGKLFASRSGSAGWESSGYVRRAGVGGPGRNMNRKDSYSDAVSPRKPVE